MVVTSGTSGLKRGGRITVGKDDRDECDVMQSVDVWFVREEEWGGVC